MAEILNIDRNTIISERPISYHDSKIAGLLAKVPKRPAPTGYNRFLFANGSGSHTVPRARRVRQAKP